MTQKFLIFFLAMPFSILAQKPVKIVDETYLDATFKSFAKELNKAVSKKDIALLRPLLADSVNESKDGCGNCPKEEFIKYYFFNGPWVDRAWKEWSRVLRFGFYKSSDDIFEAPAYRKFLNQDSALIVLGNKVNIHENPATTSKVLLQTSFEQFDCDCYILSEKPETQQWINKIMWQQVKLKDGRTGFVLGDLTTEGILRELRVKKIRGKWKVVSFFMPPGC